MPQLGVFCDIESESGILVPFILKLVAHSLAPQTHLVPDHSRSFMAQLEVFCDIAVESESGILFTLILKLVAHGLAPQTHLVPDSYRSFMGWKFL